MSRRKLTTLTAIFASGLACSRPSPTTFGDPSTLAPLEAINLAPAITEVNTLTLASGHDEEANRYWAHGRARIDADPSAVWRALRTLDVIADRREVAEWTLEQSPHPEFDYSYIVHNTVTQPVPVEYELTWVHELQAGTIADPEQVVIQWDKTSGTQFIDLLAGSIQLTAVDGGTELALIEHLRAVLRDEATLERYLRDLFADTLAASHGEPLPSL